MEASEMRHKSLFLSMLAIAAMLVAAGCETATPTQRGAAVGAGLGAIGGAIIGNQVHGQSGEGALIGAAAGGLAGALIGDAKSQQDARAATAQPAPVAPPPAVQEGHWETVTVTTQSGETYEERRWVVNK
jgi:uncharacterized protein YcfJ